MPTTYRETPEGRELIGLSQFLRGVAGRLKGKRRKPASRLRAKDLVAGTAPATKTTPARRISSARDAIAAPGAYTRRLGAVGAGARSKVVERQEAEARRRGLAEAIRTGVPVGQKQPKRPLAHLLATAGVPQVSALGRSLGRFTPAPGTSQPFSGDLGQYTRAQMAFREAMAAGQPAAYPGAYRPSTGQTMEAQQRKDLEEQLEGRRADRLARRRAGIQSPEVRGLRVMAQAQGRPLGPLQAEMAQVVRGGGRLTPEQKMALYGPAGQAMDIAGMQERTKRMEMAPGAQAAALLASEFGATLPKRTQERLVDMVMGRGEATEGPGLSGQEDLGPIGDLAGEMPEEAMDDPRAAERWIKMQNPTISQQQIDKWGRHMFGFARWKGRKAPFRGVPVVGWSGRIVEEIEEAFPGFSRKFMAPFTGR